MKSRQTKLECEMLNRTSTRKSKLESITSSRKGGAVLIVVIAMTGMLAFLGLFFFSFVSAERNSASMFAVSTREITESDYFDFAMQGILIGPTDDLRSSALYGRKYSMIPNMLGSFGPDLRPNSMQPFTGTGINVVFLDTNNDGLPDSGSSNFAFDYNGDGSPDDIDKDSTVFIPSTGVGFDGNDVVINLSPAANRAISGGNTFPVSPLGFQNHPNYVPDFEPDAGYTYPDINSMFLGYFALIDTDPAAGAETLRRVWIPSFHRPQYLPRDETVDIYTTLEYANRVLRPHREHLVRLRYRDPGNINNVLSKTVRRYVTAGSFDAVTGGAATTAFPFPNFNVGSGGYEAGLWTGGLARHADISYDIDADGLSINGKEAILLDLNHGVEILGDGSKRIPMFAITIMDADGLLNLNTAGNLYGEPTSLVHNGGGSPSGKFGNSTYVSRSNFGLSMGELNPSRAFYRPLDQPGGTPSLLPNSYEKMFGVDLTSSTVDQLAMSNMELARLLVGVADGNTGSDTDVVAGRWGDSNLIDSAVESARNNAGNATMITAPQPPYPAFSRFSTSLSAVTFPVQFPAPGRPGVDDDEDYFTGAGKARIPGGNSSDPVFGDLGISIPPSVHPGDELGIGRYSYLSDFSSTNVLQFVAQGNRGAQRRASSTATFNLATLDTHQKNPGRWGDYGASTIGIGIGDVAGFEYQIPIAPKLARPDFKDSYSSTATTPVAGVTPYSQTGFEGLFGWGELNRHVHRFSGTDREWSSYLADEPDEIAVEPAFRNLNNDALFSVNDMAFLHVSDLDWTNIGSPNRLEKLLEFNFERLSVPEPTTGFTLTNGMLVRSQFTTDSWDRWEFGMARVADTDNDGDLQDEIRGWEFNDNFSNRLAWRFPPSFATSAGASHSPYKINDPIRYEVRQWLTIEYADNPKNIFKHNRLDLNRLLTFVYENGKPVLKHRHLTPHTASVTGGSTGSDDISAMEHRNIFDPQDSKLAFQFSKIRTSKLAQEWWAKYDRQRMARDIYVLLYTLGGGDDTLNYTLDNDTNQLYTENQLREMAQFAVNVVDGMDRDDVITEFVYDINLGNGWNINGTKDGDGVPSHAEAARVFGVERQSLCFSESLWITTSGNQSMDEDSTIFDDTDSDRQHFYLELQNASPFPVSLDKGNWRIRRVDVTAGSPDSETTIASVVFEDDNTSDYSSAGDKLDVANIVEPGGYYTIGHHDGNDDVSGNQRPSDYRVETGTATEYQVLAPAKWARWRHNSLTAPAVTNSTDTPDPWVDLDLTWTDAAEEGRYEFRDASENVSTTKGILLPDTPGVTETTFILERRLHTNLPDSFNTASYTAQKEWNPWVEVDRIELNQTTFDPTGTTYSDLMSKEIREPLASTDIDDYAGGAVGEDGKSYNTLGTLNDRPTAAQFTLWQPHFDRDYTSIYDLLSIPLFGPAPETVDTSGNHVDGAEGGVTKMISNEERLSGFADVDGTVRPVLAGTAKFMRPDNNPAANAAGSAGDAPDDTGTPASSNAANDNRWYRLFEFYEVKTTAQSAFRDDLPIPRTPGKVNLNTVRHPGVLAGVIDDTYHLTNHTNPIATTEEGNARIPFRQLRDPKEAARHWGHEFFKSRDVADPRLSDANPTVSPQVYLPGIPGSRPFHPMTFLGNATPGSVADIAPQTVGQTLLRSLPLDSLLNQEESVLDRRLFEARTQTDVNQEVNGLPSSSTTYDAVDFHTRNRILSKIANNTTTRSHVFYCWIYVQFHEAAEDEFGNVQVGGVMAGQPVHRAFFVIDRSKLEEAWDPKTKTFDWRKFVTLRNVIQ